MTFSGCIRRLEANTHGRLRPFTFALDRPTHSSGIGKCFDTVRTGLSLDGTGYVNIFDRSVVVGRLLATPTAACPASVRGVVGLRQNGGVVC